jgi:hypothetical protein
MNEELAKELKDAGFPMRPLDSHNYNDAWRDPIPGGNWYYFPTLEELIEACGDDINAVIFSKPGKYWVGSAGKLADSIVGLYGAEFLSHGMNPTEAVARLWLALNKKV